MSKIVLSLESLDKLDDGRVAIAWRMAVASAIRDCVDRPGDKAVRSVTLRLDVKPTQGDFGQCDGAVGEFQIITKVPVRRSKPYSFGLSNKEGLAFSSESPENVDQQTFAELAEHEDDSLGGPRADLQRPAGQTPRPPNPNE